MALAIRTLVVCLCTVTVTCNAEFVNVKTESSTGYVGQPSKLVCVVEAQKEVEIQKVFWKRGDIVSMKMDNGVVEPKDDRLQFADTNWVKSKDKDVSLHMKDTKISDEGTYECLVVTDRGIAKGYAKLVVKGKYSEPQMTLNPRPNQNMLEFICVTSGGYPKGAIHWFDGMGTNWTRSAKTEDIEMQDKSFKLQSIFISMDPSHPPYTCVVFNSEWKEEGRVGRNLTDDGGIIGRNSSKDSSTSEQTKNIAAAVVVIGSLICGLLIALLIFRRRSRRANRRPSTQPMLNSSHDCPGEEEEVENTNLNPPPPYEEVKDQVSC